MVVRRGEGEWEEKWGTPRGKIRIATANIRGHWSFVEDSLDELNISGKEVKEVRAALTKLINAVNDRVSAESLKETAEAFGSALAGFIKWLKQQFSGGGSFYACTAYRQLQQLA